MDYIKSIEINKIKGINNIKLDLNIIPNKPSIFVASNGFGKSSIATAFDSINSNRLDIAKNNWHNNRENIDSYIKITEVKNAETIEYLIDNTSNNFSSNFDTFVINNKVTAEAKTLYVSGRSIAKSEMVIKNIVIVNTIPDKKTLNYSVYEMRSNLEKNKLLIENLEIYTKNTHFIYKMYKTKDNINNILFKKRINKHLQDFIKDIQHNNIKQPDNMKEYTNNKIIKSIEEDKDFSALLIEFEMYINNISPIKKYYL